MYNCGGKAYKTPDEVGSIAVESLRRWLTQSSYLFATLDHTSSTEYLQVIYDRLAEGLQLGYGEKRDLPSCLTVTAKEILNAYAKQRDYLPNSLAPILGTLDATRLYHLETILRQLGKNPRQWESQGAYSLKTPGQRHRLGVGLECLAGYSELLCIHPALRTSMYLLRSLQDSRCANVSVSLELFSSSGFKNYLRQVPSALEDDDTYWLNKDICGCDYLATRLAKVELLLDARDSKLHPGILDATRRIHEG